MVSLSRALALITVAAALAATAAAQGVSTLAQAVAATRAANANYTFDLEIVSSKQNWRAQYQPAANPPLRLVSPARASLDGDERRAFDRMAENMEGVSWCASEHMGRVANVRQVREDATSITYAFQPTRESVRSEQAQRYAHRMRGEFTITRENPDITAVRIYTPEAFSPLPLVRLDWLNIATRCAEAPNGRRYAAETISDVRGSAFGRDFDERTVRRVSNLH